MNKKLAIIALISLALFGTACGYVVRTDPQAPGYFPMSNGTTWTYRGSARWQREGGAITSEPVTMTFKVMEYHKARNGSVAILTGLPMTVSPFEPLAAPHLHILVKTDAARFFLDPEPQTEVDPEQALNSILQKTQDTTADQETFKMLNKWKQGNVRSIREPRADTLILSPPLGPGKKFGGEAGREDNLYSWIVESEDIRSFTNIKGIWKKLQFPTYTLVYRTVPDHQIMDFTPGIGITHYHYSHHGTVAELDLELVEFQDGGSGWGPF
ncbi:MAG: hypothetical protein NTX50_00045 [Candidatus Sumerlaeota bacterium]|nr:hypothetical protein [Candidatus Sumerlaeota bacterium]